MPTLVTIYWLCFAAGLVYVLLAGALGAITHGLAGAHPGEAGDAVPPEPQRRKQPRREKGYSPLSLLSLMGTLAGFGGGGLAATLLGQGTGVSVLAAVAGAALLALAQWLVVGRILTSLHSSSAAHVSDLVGLEAEVITPLEGFVSGEIAYMLDGTRYTAPAQLLHGSYAGRSDKVRIREVGDNLLYVELLPAVRDE